jgi:glucose-6-phosphate isomerase
MSGHPPRPAIAVLEARAGQLTATSAWSQLVRLAAAMPSLRALLDQPGRHAAYSREAAGLHLDFSRQRLDAAAFAALQALAAERELPAWIAHLFAASPVNTSEQRPALHWALRRDPGQALPVDGADIMPLVAAELERVLGLADALQSGAYRGHGGQTITAVVNLGIGGSDLGPVMAVEALRPWQVGGIRCHFVSNIDGTELADTLAAVDPARTLFIICSKSFTTLETQLNADAARRWFVARMPEAAVARHFIAVSVNDAAMDRFGIAPGNRFRIWDWVGGRYSLWSAVGLALAIAIGRANFLALLAGARAMDEHFGSASAADNLPVLLGLIGVWNQNLLGLQSHAVLPYSARLRRLPAYLQQLEMESNGKGCLRDGTASPWETGTVLWGEPGSNAQHAFFQLLHQGTAAFSADFVAPARSERAEEPDQHLVGLANMLAQAEAFARGRTAAEALREMAGNRSLAERAQLAAQKAHPGNHPSSIILLPALDPQSLGALIALYEHKVFVQSVIWGINPFDQWGVELGKVMAHRMAAAMAGSEPGTLPDLAATIRRWRGGTTSR